MQRYDSALGKLGLGSNKLGLPFLLCYFTKLCGFAEVTQPL